MSNYSWTHAICNACYGKRQAAQGWPNVPHRLVGQIVNEPCCYCDQPTQGIYVRQRPADVHNADV